MPGGLMQLVNKGAQDQLVTGSPSFTHFRSVYKRHTEFAMEHFRLDFRSTNLDLSPSAPRIFRTRVDRNAQLVHDMYIHVSLPNIFSPVNPITKGLHPEIAPDAEAIGYEFQWVPNLGYNMIRSVSVLINGTAICTHTGEWMKLYSYMTHDANKRKMIDRMVGNLPELYDPANDGQRNNQYPHSISSGSNLTQQGQSSILGRNLVIPLHFWFCEDVGSALPLIALQYSEVEIVVEFASIYDLFTVRDVRDSSTTTFGKRIRPDPAAPEFNLNKFFSPPDINGQPTNISLTTWALNPYIEANYIFLSDTEMIHLAKSDSSFKIRDVRLVKKEGLYGAGNDVELGIHNLCTRVVWITQRSDVTENNGYDNYTNKYLHTPSKFFAQMTPWYSSGSLILLSQAADNIVVDGNIILDGGERFGTKTYDFFEYLQNFKHHAGLPLDGIYSYSFAIDHTEQPSGHLNGSMFNKTILRLNLQKPPALTQPKLLPSDCVIKSTVLSNNPVPVQSAKNFGPDQVVRVVTKPDLQVYQYTFGLRAYVESYNFLRITRGIANVVFSS
jgi:hypothetical protein